MNRLGNLNHRSIVLLDATYVHHSGGKVLLEFFINHLIANHQLGFYYFIIDNRLESNLLKSCDSSRIFRIKSNESNRKDLFKMLIKLEHIDTVFCFNNVPPPFKIINKKVVILFHNILIIDKPLFRQRYKEKVSFFLKRLYISFINEEKYIWVVQSNLVKNKLKEVILKGHQKCEVLPFFNDNLLNNRLNRENSFLYVADGVSQKNHEFLFKVWERLKLTFKQTPTLYVTINTFLYPNLTLEIERLQRLGVQIVNLGIVPHAEIDKWYLKCKYVIFPSLAESFGLPLIEAAQKGNYIIAFDLPYVHEVIKPSSLLIANNINESADLLTKVICDQIKLPMTELKVKNKILELHQLLNNNI